jgi:predicted membrane-bound spermidine synthase
MALVEQPPVNSVQNPERLIYPLFALSGVAGLVYEGTWARYLKLFLGHSSYGQILTLCIYMGGLGIGSFLAGRLLSKIKRPLRAYALTELVIGVGGLLYHPVYVWITNWFYDSQWSSHLGSSGANAVKIGLAVASTAPTAILLGMTFPFIAAGLMRRHKDSGKVSVPMLYFSNSIGAAVGLLMASYILIPSLGTHGTLLMASAFNLLLAAGFLWIDAGFGPSTPMAQTGRGHGGESHGSASAPEEPSTIESLPLPGARVWFGVALFTGLTSFIYEVVWIRLLSLMMGSSTHSFDQMVSAFILGLALGSLVSKRLLRRDALVMLALAQILMGAFALSTIYTHSFFFDLMNASNLFFRESQAGYYGWSTLKYLVAVAWMVPTSFFAGMTLPFITYIVSKSTKSESPVGTVYGFNTFGAIIGSVIGGLFLIPILQLKWSLASAALVDMAIGVLLLLWFRPAWRVSVRFWGLLILCVVPVFFIEFDIHMVTSGVFRGHKDYFRKEKVWVANGRTATISFHESSVHQYIKTNGKPDASIRKDRSLPVEGDELTQAATAFMSMATRNAPYEAGMVGFGSGMSAYYLLSDPLLTRLDVVEIEKEMLTLAGRFRPFNNRAFDDPRVNLYVDDARTFFHTHGRKYDLLLSIPSNPWVSGVSSLFSQEFYQHIQRYLKPGGTLVQWLQLYEFDNTLMLHILKALQESFPYVVLYRIPEEPDIVILASDQPIRQQYIDRFGTTDSISAEFERMHRPWTLFGEQNFLSTAKGLEPLLANIAPNSEYVPWVDTRAEMTRFALNEVGLTNAFDSCGVCWPAVLDAQDFAPRKRFKDWLAGTKTPDPYLQETVRHQLRLQESLANFPDVESTPKQDSLNGLSPRIPNPTGLNTDNVWRKIWLDMRQLIQQSPFSPARDSLPEFALMRRMVDAQQVPLEISLQFELNDYLAHGKYKEAVRMFPALREVFILGTMDAVFQREMAISAFLAGDTREFRQIFSKSIMPSRMLDNSEKYLIASLLKLDLSKMSLNSSVSED